MIEDPKEKKPGRLKRLAQKLAGRSDVKVLDEEGEARLEKANREQGSLQEAVKEWMLAQYAKKLIRFGSRGRARRAEAADRRRAARKAKRAERRAERRADEPMPIRLRRRQQLEIWGRRTLRRRARRMKRKQAKASRRANRAA